MAETLLPTTDQLRIDVWTRELTATKFVIQLTATPTDPPAVRPCFGMISDRTTHAMGARPILKEITKAITETPDNALRCWLSPIARSVENSVVSEQDSNNNRLVPKLYEQ